MARGLGISLTRDRNEFWDRSGPRGQVDPKWMNLWSVPDPRCAQFLHFSCVGGLFDCYMYQAQDIFTKETVEISICSVLYGRLSVSVGESNSSMVYIFEKFTTFAAGFHLLRFPSLLFSDKESWLTKQTNVHNSICRMSQ